MAHKEAAEKMPREVAVAVDGDVMLVSGDELAVAAYVAALLDQADDVVAARDKAVVASGALALSAAAGIAGTAGEYFRFSPESMKLLGKYGPYPTKDGLYKHAFVKDQGKFAGNLQWEQVQMAGQQALAVQTAAASAALMLAISEVQSAVERVEDKVDEVLAFTEAQHFGDVVGRYRFLQQRADQADQGGRISQADWDAVAGVGADVAVTVERLRTYLVKALDSLPVNAPADDRAEKLERLVKRGRFAEALGLLVIAEQSQFLWHRLHLRQVEQREPEHLADAIAGAKAVLRTAEQLDGALVSRIYETLARYAAIRPLELHRRFSRRKLKKDVAKLRQALEQFAAARNAQVSTWPELQDPTLREAVHAINDGAKAVGAQMQELGAGAVSAAGRTFERLGQAMQRDQHREE